MDRRKIEDVGRELHGVARTWWRQHSRHFESMGEAEAAAIFRAMWRSPTRAKLAVARTLTPAELLVYMRSTTAELEGIAQGRAAILDALSDLGRRAARLIAGAALGAI